MMARSMSPFVAAASVLVVSPLAFCVTPVVVTLPAVLDNTLYENPAGNVSNGQGPNIYAGQTNAAGVRRALVKFDVSSIPANATITIATLTLNLTQSISFGDTQSVHKVLAAWGEGASTTGSTEESPGGRGANAAPGDATWIFRLFPGTAWAAAGGDFVAASSASTTVDGEPGPFTWTGASLAADVQSWLVTPASNFGWVVRGIEGGGLNAKRYASSENPDEALRPVLSVSYTVPPPCVGDLNGDHAVNTVDLTLFLGAFGTSVTPGTGADLNNDGSVNTADLVLFLGAFGLPC